MPGCCGLHALKQDIFDAMVSFMKHTYGGSWRKSDLECLVSDVDRMTVLIDEETEGVVVVFLFDGCDEDEEDHQSKKKGKGVASTDWTCLRECLSFQLPSR